MKRIASVLFALGGAFFAAEARGAAFDCGFTVVPAGGSAYSVLFDSVAGFFADRLSPAVCDIAVPVTPVVLGAGEFAVYKADYRGFLLQGGTGRITVANSGATAGATVPAVDGDHNGLYLESYAAAIPGDATLNSSIMLELLGYDPSAPDTIFTLDSIDYLLVRTTATDIQTSVDQFAANHTSLITHLNATADLLTGAGQKLEQDDGVTALAGLGSFTLGATGRRNLDGGFTLLGGAAVFDQSAGGSTASGLLLSGSLRYIAPGDGFVRPYGEIGLISAPAMGLSFTRSYVTSTGTTTATGSGAGALYGGFVKGGALLAPNPDNEIVFAATLAKDWLLTGAYTETLSGSNLFAASSPAQTSSFDTVKAGVDWTTKLVPKTELTLSAALGATIAENTVATNVAFAGTFSGAPRSELFAEYGARVAYEIDPAQSIGAFVHGSTGQYSGTHVQVGGDFHVRF